jgi:hypothetical protein
MSKIGRNEPCPCGSGKKYKKCCFGKDDVTTAEYERKESEFESLMEMMVNLHRSLLDDKPHIKEYKKIRLMHSEIVSSMMDYYEQGKFEPWEKTSHTDGLDAEGVDSEAHVFSLLEASFDPEEREGQQGLAEVVIYKTASNTICLTEEFLNKHRYRKPEKIEFLQCMLDSQAGLFEITSIDRENGYACIRDVFAGCEYKITDTGLSGAPNFDEIYIYTRIITYRGVSFGTGLSLTFGKMDPFIADYIQREQKSFEPNQEFRRFIELYNQFARNPKKYKIIPHKF